MGSDVTTEKYLPEFCKKTKKKLVKSQQIMVCISCIVIPVVLWLWHRFLQPFVYNFMGWAQVENKTESTIEGEKAKLTCPMSKSSEAPQDQDGEKSKLTCPMSKSNGAAPQEVLANGKAKSD